MPPANELMGRQPASLDSPARGRVYALGMSLSCCTSGLTLQAQSADCCLLSGTKGRKVPVITLKSLLRPDSLARLAPDVQHYFCPDAGCKVAYFSADGAYHRHELKVPVYQKDDGADVPVCYCFGWTRATIADAAALSEEDAVAPSISAHIKAGRCGCEVNNPQGACCLGNVITEVQAAKQLAVAL